MKVLLPIIVVIVIIQTLLNNHNIPVHLNRLKGFIIIMMIFLLEIVAIIVIVGSILISTICDVDQRGGLHLQNHELNYHFWK